MTTTPSGPTFPGSDINGDGHADILWRNSSTGDLAAWYLEGPIPVLGSSVASGLQVPEPWSVVGMADFNGNGTGDLLWRNPASGEIAVWYLDATGALIGGESIPLNVPGDWRLSGVGDFNSNQKTDIIWHNTTTGDVVVWYMDGFTPVASESLGVVGGSWRISGVGDFNNDGKDDLVWHDPTTGDIAFWYLDGIAFNGVVAVGAEIVPLAVGSPWEIRGTGDFNTDGRTDLLWWNSQTGEVAAWFMNGSTPEAGVLITTLPDTNWKPLTQARGGLPDLTVENITGLPVTLSDGETANLSFSVANQGTRTAGASTFRYFLSNDAVFDPATDTPLGTISVEALRAGQSASFSRSFTYNASTMGDSGTKYLFFVADANGVVPESNETNNVVSRSFEVASTAPLDIDLVLQNPVLPDTWTAGREASVTVTLANLGTELAGASTLAVYILDTPTFDPRATPVASNRIESLGGNLNVTRTFTFEYLESFGIGQKYLFLVADAAGEVRETDETNNILSFEITVEPAPNVDFAITNVVAPDGITIGQFMTVSVTVANLGTTASPATTLNIFTSDFTGSGDVFNPDTARSVASAPVNALNAGATGTISLTFIYDSLFGAGLQNLFFVVDVDNQVEEANEMNNIFKELLDATPPQNIDLVVLNPTISSTTVLPGQTVTLSAQVQNLGSVGANGTSLRVYLSNDTTLDRSTDILVGGTFISALSGGATSSVRSFTFTYPVDGASGTKYILFVADDDNEVFETNELNNVSPVQFTVPSIQPGIDLFVSSATLSSQEITAGTSLTVTATVVNQGQDASGPSRLGIYLSDNEVFDPTTDRLLETVNIDSLTTLQNASRNITFTYLSEFGLGNKFILVVADDNNQIAESNEANNVQAIALSILSDPNRPDLVVDRIEDLAPSLADGITLRYFIGNQGLLPTTTGSITTAFYLSNTPITSMSGLSSAVLLSNNTINDNIDPEGELSALLTLEPIDDPLWSAGVRYVVVVVDPANAILESDETNNIRSFEVTLVG